MNYFRAILSGIIVWMCVIITFTVLSYIPGIKDSFILQTIVVGIVIIAYARLAAMFYYKKNVNDHGLKVGLVLSATALVLDALITVPFFEIPKGSDYVSFFSSPALWLLVSINLITVYFYWRKRVRAIR